MSEETQQNTTSAGPTQQPIEEPTSNKRIAKNALMLYIRMFLIMLVNLFTQRVILESLGVVDYGVYNVVGGIVVMFSIISGTLSTSISRFITFELGRQDFSQLKKVFSTSVSIQIVISVICVLLAETIGIWFINTQLNIPSNRIIAANWVFQFSIATFVLGLINVPYSACIIAHERMHTFAIIGIIEVMGKLFIAYTIFVSPIDKLIFYSALLLILFVFIRGIYITYCKRQFSECKYILILDIPLIKKMITFSGWNFIGATASVLRETGVNITLNIFCGPIVNASRGIANNINAAVSAFAANFLTAVNPQITKSFANNKPHESFNLVLRSSRFSLFLLLLIGMPMLAETETIVNIWLKEVPDYAIVFTRYVIVYTFIVTLSYPLITLMLATGKIKRYQLVVGGAQLLNLPISYLFLKLGYEATVTYVVLIVLEVLSLFLRLFMLRGMVGFPVDSFIKDVLIKGCIVFLITGVTPFTCVLLLSPSISRLVVTTLLSTIASFAIIFFIGCTKKEKVFLLKKVHLMR